MHKIEAKPDPNAPNLRPATLQDELSEGEGKQPIDTYWLKEYCKTNLLFQEKFQRLALQYGYHTPSLYVL